MIDKDKRLSFVLKCISAHMMVSAVDHLMIDPCRNICYTYIIIIISYKIIIIIIICNNEIIIIIIAELV